MSWPRRHELIDVDLDAYADEAKTPESAEPRREERELRHAVEQKRVSVLEAAERAGIPLEELLRRLRW